MEVEGQVVPFDLLQGHLISAHPQMTKSILALADIGVVRKIKSSEYQPYASG